MFPLLCIVFALSELQSDSEIFSNRLCDTHLALDAIFNTPGNYDNKALRQDASKTIILMKKLLKYYDIIILHKKLKFCFPSNKLELIKEVKVTGRVDYFNTFLDYFDFFLEAT